MDLSCDAEDLETLALIENLTSDRTQRRRPIYGGLLFISLALLGFIGFRNGQFSYVDPLESTRLSETGAHVVPVRILLFRHGFTCANAGHTGACMDPEAPILHLSESEREALFDKLDSIGTKLPAPYVVPPINRSAGIEGRGKKYKGGRPPRPASYRGDDCILHLHPWTDKPEKQWHEAGNVIQMRHYYRDPLLTTCSVFQSEKAGRAFRAWLKKEGIKLDFLAASLLARTFQTAYYQLLDTEDLDEVFSPEMLTGDRDPLVSQVPFVNEFNTIWGYQADDVAWPQEEQLAHLSKALGESAVQHLDYSHLEGFTEEERMGHDWELFKEKVLGQRIVPQILKRKHKSALVESSKPPNARNGDSFKREEWALAAKKAAGPTGSVQPVVNIGMASHSGVIQEVCRFESRSSSNNAVVEMLILVEINSAGTETIVRQEVGTCTMVMDAPKQPHNLDRRDVANCAHPFDFSQAFVEHSSEPGQHSTCEEVALANDAYPTVSAEHFD